MTGAGTGLLTSFLKRAKNILLHPGTEWQAIKGEESTRRQLMARYGAIIAAVPPIAALIERFTFGKAVVSSAVHSPPVYVFATNAVWYLVIIVNVLITGMVMTAIADRSKIGTLGLAGLKLAVYAFTPLFLVSLIAMIPRLNWVIYAAILYSIYELYVGFRALCGVDGPKAAWYTAASFAACGLILGALNTFEYMLESFITGKIFF